MLLTGSLVRSTWNDDSCGDLVRGEDGTPLVLGRDGSVVGLPVVLVQLHPSPFLCAVVRPALALQVCVCVCVCVRVPRRHRYFGRAGLRVPFPAVRGRVAQVRGRSHRERQLAHHITPHS